ncbi:MAG TPA: AIM24 family protein [Blastocatellia bacterium]|nr:AIM24 family protein [Blastocatellia bacterium]
MSGLPSHPTRKYTCQWCGHTGEGVELSCPACGAAVDLKEVVTDSGWEELPGIRDMAKIQFGKSHCQIEGLYVPVADMNLSPEDWVYFAHHVLLWKDPQVTVSAMSLKGAWKRMMAGLPIIMTAARGPGHIAFSRDQAGEMMALPLQPGQAVDVREHMMIVATGQISYDWFQSGIWFNTGSGNDQETHYPLGMYLDRFFAPQVPGLIILHAAGNCFVRTLGPNESILVKPTALLFKDPHVRMQLHIEQPAGNATSWGLFSSTWNQRYLWLRLFGPGRVAVQSAYKHMEDNGRYITGHSGASFRQW